MVHIAESLNRKIHFGFRYPDIVHPCETLPRIADQDGVGVPVAWQFRTRHGPAMLRFLYTSSAGAGGLRWWCSFLHHDWEERAIIMLPRLLSLILIVSGAAAQSGPAAPALGSISGVVKDAATNAPIPHAVVTVITNTKSASGGGFSGAGSTRISSTTDDAGRYSLADLPLGPCLVFAVAKDRHMSRPVTLSPGQQYATADFALPAAGTVSGAVADDNDDPVPDLGVYLIAREYQAGLLRLVIKDRARTDDKGEYRLGHAEQGRAYFLLARRAGPLDPVSDVPADPKLRKPILAPTYYPSSADIDGAVPVELPRNGWTVEGLKIRMPKIPCYCIEGALEAGGRPAALTFMIESDAMTGGAFFPPGGKSGPDGRIRICGTRPG
jgi:hypothetical protein